MVPHKWAVCPFWANSHDHITVHKSRVIWMVHYCSLQDRNVHCEGVSKLDNWMRGILEIGCNSKYIMCLTKSYSTNLNCLYIVHWCVLTHALGFWTRPKSGVSTNRKLWALQDITRVAGNIATSVVEAILEILIARSLSVGWSLKQRAYILSWCFLTDRRVFRWR